MESQHYLEPYGWALICVWALACLVGKSLEYLYIKHIVMTIGLNTWSLVLYHNLEALLLFPFELLIPRENLQREQAGDDHTLDYTSMAVWFPVALACLSGLAISFFGFSCRKKISATSFTVVNKLITEVVCRFIWNVDATPIGTVGLLICIGGGVLYQQSTSKPQAPPVPVLPKSKEAEEKQSLLRPENNEPRS